MISEERLRQAAHEAGRALGDSLPDPEACRHTFSPAFEKRMDTLQRKSRYMGLNQGLRRVACFFLALLVCGGTWLSVDAGARYSLFGWAREQTEDGQRYFHQGGNTVAPGTYEIQVPEGYTLVDRIENGGYWNEYYLNEAGEYIDFSYCIETANTTSQLFIGATEAERTTVVIHGVEADLYTSKDNENDLTVVWTEPGLDVLIQVSAMMDKEDFLELAESVSLEKNK